MKCPFFISVLVLTVSSTAWAAPRATVETDRTHLQLGQPIQVTLRLYSCEGDPTIEPPTSSDLTLTFMGKGKGKSTVAALPPSSLPQVQYLRSNQQLAGALRELSKTMPPDALPPDLQKVLADPQAAVTPVSTGERWDHVFVYQAQPRHTGNFSLPAFMITVDGQTLKTRPVALTVDAVQPQDLVKVRVSLANPAPLVGEETELYVDMFVPRRPVRVAGRDFPCLPFKDVHLSFPDLDRLPQIELARPLDVYIREHAIPKGQRGMRINAFYTEVAMEQEPPDFKGDPNVYRRRLTFPVRLRAAGRLEIPPFTVSGEIYNLTAGRASWETFVAPSEPLAVDLRDVTGRKDRPDDFAGAIGRFRISSQASLTTLPVGTPFTLTVRVEGQGSLPRDAAPDLGRQPEFTKRFRVRLDGERTTADKAREFTYTLRPLAEDVTEVPAIHLTYFDASADRFETVQAQPITLTVTPATNVTPEPTAPEKQPETTVTEEPLPWQSVDAEQLKDWGWQALPWVGLLAGLVVSGYTLRRGLRWWRQRKPVVGKERTRSRDSAVIRRKLQGAAGSPAEVRQALSDFLRIKFGLPEGEVTPGDVREKLGRAGVSEGLAYECADLLERCAAAEFGSGSSGHTPGELARAAKQLLEALERPGPGRSLLGRLALVR